MASKSAQFFENGTNKQFEFVFSKYQEALQAKADSKNSKSEILIKLDKWYQNELPKKIKSRGKEAHLTHEEIVQTIKWKLARGKFYPQLTNLVRINTPRAVQTESRKAFRKLPNLDAAITTLCGLKGVGTTLASAVLAAGAPEIAPFMADELLMSMPEVEGIDYTMKEYMKLVEKTKECVDRLNAQGGSWNPHKVEMTVWTYYIARDLKPELLDDMPDSRGNTYAAQETVKEVVEERVNGENGVNGEVSRENGDPKEEKNEVVDNQTNGVGAVDTVKSAHSMSPEPESEPVGFTEPASFSSEPMGFNYNGVGSEEANDRQHAEEMPTDVHVESVVDERQLNGESTKEVPALENGSYNTYNYPESAPMYPPSTNPDPVEAHPVADYLPHPVETPVYSKRPLEEETEEATPESKRVRDESFPTPEPTHSAPTHSQEGVPPPTSTPVAECPAPNGVNSAPPQPIHTGAD